MLTKPYDPAEVRIPDPPDPSFAPLLVLTGVLTLAILAEAITRNFRALRYGGLLVQAGPNGRGFTIAESSTVPYGKIYVVLPPDKISIVEAAIVDSDFTDKILKALVELRGLTGSNSVRR